MYPQYKVLPTSVKLRECWHCMNNPDGCDDPRCFNNTIYDPKTLQQKFITQPQAFLLMATEDKKHWKKKKIKVMKKWRKVVKRKANVMKGFATTNDILRRYKKKARKK